MEILSPYAPTTREAALLFMQRAVNAKDGDEDQVIAAVNAAVAWMESRTGRKLMARIYRNPVTLTGLTIAANGTDVTGTGFTAGVKVDDDLVGTGVAIGARVTAVTSNSAITITPGSAAASGLALTFGSSPLQIDGDGDELFQVPQYPVNAFYGMVSIDFPSTKTAFDLTNLRFNRETGRARLPGIVLPDGDMNIEIECHAGYRAPSATSLGDWAEYQDLRRLCHRMAQCYFQDWANASGRMVSKSLGPGATQLPDFKPPDDVLDGIQRYVRQW